MNMQLRTPQVALVGHGHWGRNLARCLDQLGALYGVIDPAPVHPVGPTAKRTRRLRNLDEALSDPRVEAIAIASPAVTHADIALPSLRAGRHVFVEKPMTLSANSASELIKVADAADRRLMVGHLMRYHPGFEQMLREIAGGRIGKPKHIHSRRLSPGKLRADENVLWSFAPHDISMALAIAGKVPDEVNCFGGSALGNGSFDAAHLHLKFDNYMTAFIDVSWAAPVKEQKLTVTGNKGALVLDDRPESPEMALVFYPHTVSHDSVGPNLVQYQAQPIATLRSEPLMQEISHFIDCLRDSKDPRTPGVEGRTVVEILERAQNCLDMA